MKAFALTLSVLILSFTTVFSQHQEDGMIVFVGEKIDLTYVPQKNIVKIDSTRKGIDSQYVRTVTTFMDSKFLARYRILQMVYGKYKADTIDFTVYDHYGKPPFSFF